MEHRWWIVFDHELPINFLSELREVKALNGALLRLLQLLLARDGGDRIIEDLVMDQAIDSVPLREPGDRFDTVFISPFERDRWSRQCTRCRGDGSRECRHSIDFRGSRPLRVHRFRVRASGAPRNDGCE